MRDFLLNSEGLLDRFAVSCMEDARQDGLLPCRWIRFNDRIKLGYFTEGYRVLTDEREKYTIDELCEVGIRLLERIENLESYPQISLENVVWDDDSIYLDRQKNVFLICLPAVIPEETLRSQIYIKRVYALLVELFEGRNAEEIIRQIDYQQKKHFGNWASLREVLERAMVDDDEDTLILRSINTPTPLRFVIGHNDFLIGTDAGEVSGVITDVETVSPVHALIGWNEIGHFIIDKGSEGGTFVNDQQITPNIEVPIGKGTVLRFADCTFNVE